MKNLSNIVIFLILIVVLSRALPSFGGVTPEQIYQPTIDWNDLIGTWEVLPEDNPLDEKAKTDRRQADRMLMTLRKDGTCRVFSKAHPMGSDGLWTAEDHRMLITFPNGNKVDFYVYGIKADFMITLSPIKDGKDLLWSRVK